MSESPDILLADTNGTRTNFIIVGAIVASLFLIAVVIWDIFETQNLSTRNVTKSIELTKLSDALGYYDEVLTMSANMVAVTGNLDWQRRYNHFAPKLDEAIEQARTSATNKILDDVFVINTRLVAIENKLFSLSRENKTREAMKLINSRTYIALKAEYAKGVMYLREALEQQANEVVAETRRHQQNTIGVLIILFLFLIGIWWHVLRSLKESQTKLVSYHEHLTSLAHYDPLTGLANRTLFQVRLKEALTQSRRHGQFTALLLIDLDNFKDINDNLGHPVGDKLLKSISEKLIVRSRETDTVVRLGGDEFAIIATYISESKNVAKLANDILKLCQRPSDIDGEQITASASIGIAMYPADAENEEELLRKADLALYKAKESGRNTYKYFDVELETYVRNRQLLQAELEKAFDEKQFSLVYQPIIDITTQEVAVIQASIEWQHPEKGAIPAEEFLPIAEASGLIIPLGHWMFGEMCKQHSAWQTKGLPPLNIAVNLTATQFNDDLMLPMTQKILADTDMKPRYLTLEITENTIMHANASIDKKLAVFNELGVKLSIDAFGTGYSSLSYLKRLPVHYLKIHRTFTEHLPTDLEDAAIARTIIGMGREMGLKVIAEGVESEAQLDFLAKEVCDLALGNYFCGQHEANDFVAWYKNAQGSSEPSLTG